MRTLLCILALCCACIPYPAFACEPCKQTICHIPPGNPSNVQTITVGCASVTLTAHLKHGDYLGACKVPTPTPTATCTPKPTPTPTPKPKDCLGVVGGTAMIDDCGICAGLNKDKDCSGVCFGKKVVDVCNICGGESSCLDCAGVPFGQTVVDLCGVCGGKNDCLDCAGVPNGKSVVDLCGVCGGTNSCLDCAGIPNGTNKVDSCGVCGGNNSCDDCAGVPYGRSTIDACGVCGGNGSSCADCSGVSNGTKVVDACGVCGGPGKKLVTLKVDRKSFIIKINEVVDLVINRYIAVGQSCDGRWGNDLAKKSSRLSNAAYKLVQKLVFKAKLCPGQCIRNINKKTLRKLNVVLTNLNLLAKEVRGGAVAACHGSGGNWLNYNNLFNNLHNNVNSCPTKACNN